MAPGLSRWLGAGLLACAVIAAAFVPPRGGARARGSRVASMERSRRTPARLRAQALAAQWGAVSAEVRIAEARARLGPGPAPLGADSSSLVLVIIGPDSLARRVRPVVASALDTVWRRLGLRETKVGVVFVLNVVAGTGGERTYLLPDSSDRTTCSVLQSAGWWARAGQRVPTGANLEGWLQNSLGPCAFFAAYGTPGRPVRHWLGERNFDVALYPDWTGAAGPTGVLPFMYGRGGWWWDGVYRSPAATVGCLGGRPPACRAAVLRGAASTDDSVSRVVTSNTRWWLGQSLIPAERYLADVASDVGPERFLRFWNSPLPVDTALTLALGKPIGEWTARWERRFGRPLPLGPAAPLGAAALALLVAAAAVSIAAVGASRRQVR
jgi:hypothetical protein